MLSIEILRTRLHHCVGSRYDPKALQRGHQLSKQIDQMVIAYMKLREEYTATKTNDGQ